MVALFQKSRISKLAPCGGFSITGLQALMNEALFQHLDVKLDLIFQFAIGRPLGTRDECPDPCLRR